MHTYLLSDDTVRRYMLDFADRLEKLSPDFPYVWIALGRSGDKIATSLGNVLSSELQSKLRIVRASFDRSNSCIVFRDDLDWD